MPTLPGTLPVVITYGPGIQRLDPEAEGVLRVICGASEVIAATVTSTGRTVQRQAEVMFSNCLKDGAEKEKALYKEPGKRVIEVYEKYAATLPREAVISFMVNKILEVGSGNVSHHVADGFHWVFDVAPNSIPQERREAFVAAAATHPRVSKFLKPPADDAFHLEVTKHPVDMIS